MITNSNLLYVYVHLACFGYIFKECAEMRFIMSEWQEFTAKTVDEALTNAVVSMQTSSDQLEYEVIEEG